ncbi:unnamed protein product [Macrosiphum euphorbiae]|uniref:MULE transposase domain-containing protein n=1 Tax=Macrosiphum euphorbiae TaxID=13131 RepID=A0AAV0W3B6_9HEMI|nr:unnamed protein product [Macrosiphum euphorbiae]
MISRFTSKCIHNNSKGCYKNCFCYCLDIINHDHNYFGVQEPVVDHNEPLLPVAVVRPQSYTVVLGIQRGTEIIRDNLGFMYYKNKVTDTKIYLSCYKKKLEGQCHATAHISPNRNDDRLTLSKRHCHGVREFNLNVPLLRQEITEKALEITMNSYTPRGIYMQAIANFPEAAENYTFIQSVERMRRLRHTFFPQTPRNMANLHDLLTAADNECFAMTLQNPPNRFYQGPLLVEGTVSGVIFCNVANINAIAPDLRNIRVAGCDGTFKTVPKFLENDAYQLFSFQVVFKDVSFPLVHALLIGKTQQIYVELLHYIRNVLPLCYDQLTIITDFEQGLINAVNLVFPESKHQGCYFHYCQAVIRYARNKRSNLFQLFKADNNAARVLRMILALPYLPATQIGDVLPSMEDGFNSIVEYVNQFPYLALQLNQFMFNYIWGYWFITMGPAAVTVFNQVIRTNNYVESYHASLLRLIKPHPKVWEFLKKEKKVIH